MESGSNKLFVPFLVLSMLVTGVASILLAKYQDQQCVRHCTDADVGRRETFEQPVIQTAQMFVGEAGCWLVAKGTALFSRRFVAGLARSRGYTAIATTDANDTSVAPAIRSGPAVPTAPNTSSTWRGSGGSGGGAQQHRSRTGRNILLLAVTTLLDICGTTLKNTGLLFTAPSLFQMMRGLVVLFVGCFSYICFRRRLRSAQYVGIVGVVLGVAIAGTAGVLDAPDMASGALVSTSTAYYTMIGILLITGAQVFTAWQLVVEECIFAGSPVQTIDVAGYEGLLGVLFMTVILTALYLAVGQFGTGRLGPLDIVEGWRQLTTVKPVLVSGILHTISIGLSNYSGLAVTKQISATSRSTIATSLTFFVWMFSLSFGWETFKWLQAVGFFVILCSTLLFHEMVRLPCVDDEGLQIRG